MSLTSVGCVSRVAQWIDCNQPRCTHRVSDNDIRHRYVCVRFCRLRCPATLCRSALLSKFFLPTMPITFGYIWSSMGIRRSEICIVEIFSAINGGGGETRCGVVVRVTHTLLSGCEIDVLAILVGRGDPMVLVSVLLSLVGPGLTEGVHRLWLCGKTSL